MNKCRSRENEKFFDFRNFNGYFDFKFATFCNNFLPLENFKQNKFALKILSLTKIV